MTVPLGGLCCLYCLSSVALAQTAAELTELPLEELMGMEVVASTAAKRERKVEDTAAPVFVITAEDIRRSGVKTLPDLLKMVPGLQVSRLGGSEWAVSSRGLGGRFSRYLLVMIDGRSIYNPMFSGVNWDEYNLILEDVERIDVVRGPSGNLWGSNAVNGVINIVTRAPTEAERFVSVGGGRGEKGFVSARHSGEWEGGGYRVSAQYAERDGLESSLLQLEEDDWDSARLAAAASWQQGRDQFDLRGDLYSLHTNNYWPVFQTTAPFLTPIHPEEDKRGYSLQGNWRRTLSDASYLGLRLAVDNSERESDLFDWQTTNTDIELEYVTEHLRNHTVNTGVYARFTNSDLDPSAAFGVVLAPGRRDITLYNAYLQDNWNFARQWELNTGLLFEQHSETGRSVQPSLRLLWGLESDHRIWAGVSQAQSTPSRAINDGSELIWGVIPAESDLLPAAVDQGLPAQVTLASPPETLENAEVTAYEFGYRFTPGGAFSADLSLYYNDYRHLLSTGLGGMPSAQPELNLNAQPPVFPSYLNFPLYYGDDGRATGRGAELALYWQAAANWRLQYSGSYSEFDADTSGAAGGLFASGTVIDQVPEHSHSLRSLWKPLSRVELDVWLTHVDGMADIDIDSYTSANLRLQLELSDELNLSVNAQNLIDSPRVEFVREAFLVDRFEVERGAYLQLDWSY